MRNPEIGDHSVSVRKQNVGRLDIPMHQPVRMRVRERVGDFACNVERIVYRELAFALDAAGE
jgi:hypothetical protein